MTAAQAVGSTTILRVEPTEPRSWGPFRHYWCMGFEGFLQVRRAMPCYTLRATHCALHTAHTLLHTLLHTARTLLHTAHYTLRARCYTRVQQPCPQTLTWGRQFDYPYDWEKFKPSNELRAERHDHHALRARLWGERVAQHVEAGCEGDWTVSYGHGRDMAWVSRLSHRSWCPSGLPDPMLQCGRWCFDGRRLCAKPDAAMVHQWEAAEDMHGGVGGAKMHPAQLLQRF